MVFLLEVSHIKTERMADSSGNILRLKYLHYNYSCNLTTVDVPEELKVSALRPESERPTSPRVSPGATLSAATSQRNNKSHSEDECKPRITEKTPSGRKGCQ